MRRMLLEDRSDFKIWAKNFVQRGLISKAHLGSVWKMKHSRDSSIDWCYWFIAKTNHWSLIEAPRTRTVLFNVPTRTETENLKMQREWSTRSVDWGSGSAVGWSNLEQRQLVVAFLRFCFVLSCCCCSWEKRGILSSFVFLLIWRVSKPRRPRAKFA